MACWLRCSKGNPLSTVLDCFTGGRMEVVKARRRRLGVLRLVKEPIPGPSSPAVPVALRCPREVAALMNPLAERQDVESFWILCLDSQHRLIGNAPVEVTRGILNSSVVHAREVFRAAIVAGAAAIVLCHNHPSGDTTPSADDRLTTEALVAAGRILEIPVLDHIIVGGVGRFTSFADARLL